MIQYDKLRIGEHVVLRFSVPKREFKVADLKDPERRKVGCVPAKMDGPVEYWDVSELALDEDAQH